MTDPLACWQHPAAHLQHNTSQHSTAQDSIVGYNNELLQAPSRTTYHGTAQFAQGTTKNCVPDPSACWQHSDVHLQHSTAQHGTVDWGTTTNKLRGRPLCVLVASSGTPAAQHSTARIIARHSGHRVRKQAARQNPQRVGGTKLHTCRNTHHSIAQHSTA